MPIDYSVNALLTSVKQRAMSASNQNLFQDADIIRIASEELQGTILPFIESVKGEYFVTSSDTPFVQGGTNYIIPQRATGSKLRDIMLIDQSGNKVLLKYINPEDLKSSWAYAPYQFGFYMQDNLAVLVLGNLLGSGNYTSVRFMYFRRPNTLCLTGASGNAAKVVSFNTGAQTITVDIAPTTWSNTTIFDIVNSNPPFESHGDNLAITNIAGAVLTLTNPLPTNLAVGDYIGEANFSAIPQIPVECHRLLEILTAARMLQYMGDPAFQVMQGMAEAQKKDLFEILNPRVDGSPRKIPIHNALWGSW